MPELPEVETTVRYLRPHLEQQTITQIKITNGGERHFNLPTEEVEALLNHALIKKISRYGKWITLELNKDNEQFTAVAHLRMSGRYLVEDKPYASPHNRYHLVMDNGKTISYLDIRRFGTFHILSSIAEHPTLQTLGPDALTAAFTAPYLQTRLQSVNKSIYNALLDQKIVAGLGNIYVNEALHAAEIHPLQPASSLTAGQLTLLVQNIKAILTQALSFKGTTLIDNSYRDPEGNVGEFAKLLKVYGKHKDADIEVLKIGGRSVFVHKRTKFPRDLNPKAV